MMGRQQPQKDLFTYAVLKNVKCKDASLFLFILGQADYRWFLGTGASCKTPVMTTRPSSLPLCFRPFGRARVLAGCS